MQPPTHTHTHTHSLITHTTHTHTNTLRTKAYIHARSKVCKTPPFNWNRWFWGLITRPFWRKTRLFFSVMSDKVPFFKVPFYCIKDFFLCTAYFQYFWYKVLNTWTHWWKQADTWNIFTRLHNFAKLYMNKRLLFILRIRNLPSQKTRMSMGVGFGRKWRGRVCSLAVCTYWSWL